MLLSSFKNTIYTFLGKKQAWIKTFMFGPSLFQHMAGEGRSDAKSLID